MSEIYFAYLLGKNSPPSSNYLYLVKQKKSVTKIMLATEYSSLRTPKKTPPPKHALPTIFQSSSIYPHHFSDSCGTPMAPSRNTWLKRIIASLSPLSADNFHHFTASRNLADWRKSSPKNLPRSPVFR